MSGVISHKKNTDNLILFLDTANDLSYTGGTIFNDLTLLKNNGTLFNQTYYGNNAGVLRFNGVNTKVEVESNTYTNLTGQFSILVWVKPIHLPNNGQLQSIVCKYDNTTSTVLGGYDLRIYRSGGILVGLTSANSNTLSYGGGDVNYDFLENKWYQIVGVFDGSQYRLYVNGQQIGTIFSSIGPTSCVKKLYIGEFGYYSSINADLGRYFNGDISQVSIYNRVLTNTEILEDYNHLKYRFL